MAAIIDYRGKTPKKTSSGVPLVTAKVIKGGRLLEPTEFIAEEDYDSWMRRGLPEAGDVLITTEAPLGEVAQLSRADVALAQRVILLRGRPGLLDNTFLKFLMLSANVQHQLRSRSSGTTVTGIKQRELRKVTLTLPSVTEQRRIAHVLGSLDDKIELNRKMNETLEELARAIFKSWFVDFDPVHAKAAGKKPFGMDDETAALFPDSFEDSELGPIPQGWRADAVSSLSQLNPEKWSKKHHPEVVHYLDLKGVKWGRMEPPKQLEWDSAPSRARRVVRSSDTIVGTVRPANGSYGYIHQAMDGLTAALGLLYCDRSSRTPATSSTVRRPREAASSTSPQSRPGVHTRRLIRILSTV